MQQDFSKIEFNHNHRKESAAREAAIGLRWVILAIVLNVAAIAASLLTLITKGDEPVLLALPSLLLMIAAFACGAYGVYAMLDSLGWSGFVSVLIIGSLLIPYFKLITLIVVSVKALDLVRESRYRFSLFGALKKKNA